MRVVSWASKHALLLGGCSLFALCQSSAIVEAAQPFLIPGSLIVSTSTYSNAQGAIANLHVGSQLPSGSTKATCQPFSQADAPNDYVNVWNNEGQDPSFGVTSPVQLLDVNATTGQVLTSVSVPSSQVVTSFSSKSELGLHFVTGPSGPLLTFVAYGGAGVGAIDVSNSDAVAGQDATNPVTCFFGTAYAFPRTVVTVGKTGAFTYTPTVDYGGNNGRSALYAPETGLYYSVGNANNGNSSSYTNNTRPNVTETTGLEAITPLNWPTWNFGQIPANGSAQVDPMYTSVTGDKAGKDSNFRGVTEYNGALYFTKGSGSNGIDTVYTVTPGLPTVANATNAAVGIVPGFPTDSAKVTGGDFTPFAVFFANATTMYVTDEGTGNAGDKANNAGLEKWSLVNGTWQLDYVLTKGLIGTSYTLTGYDGQYPTVTTSGLRNLSGTVSGGNVTLWATTSTTSSSGDNGADPNEVVAITDQLSATQPSQVTNESFDVVEAPVYGSVYRGVAYVAN